MGKKLQVLVVFEFDGIDDPNSVEAEMVIDEVTMETKQMEFNRVVSVWVQDATIREGEEV
jgi:hypothetical protein